MLGHGTIEVVRYQKWHLAMPVYHWLVNTIVGLLITPLALFAQEPGVEEFDDVERQAEAPAFRVTHGTRVSSVRATGWRELGEPV